MFHTSFPPVAHSSRFLSDGFASRVISAARVTRSSTCLSLSLRCCIYADLCRLCMLFVPQRVTVGCEEDGSAWRAMWTKREEKVRQLESTMLTLSTLKGNMTAMCPLLRDQMQSLSLPFLVPPSPASTRVCLSYSATLSLESGICDGCRTLRQRHYYGHWSPAPVV